MGAKVKMKMTILKKMCVCERERERVTEKVRERVRETKR